MRLLALARDDAGWLALGLASLLARLPFSLAAPHFISRAIGACIDADAKALRVALELFAIAGGVNAALDFWNVFLFALAQNRVVRRLRATLFDVVLAQPIAFFDENSSGSIVSRLTSDTTEIASNLSWVFRNVTEAVVRVLGAFVFTLVPIRPRSRGARRSMRTFSPGARFSPPRVPRFRFRSRHTSTPFDSV